MRVQNFIDGCFTDAASTRRLDLIEPATGLVYGSLPDSDASDVNAAVEAAQRASSEWAATPPERRAGLLRRVAELIERDLEALARAESVDTGKPLTLARSMDIPRAAANFRFFASAIEQWGSQSHSMVLAGAGHALNYTLRQPLGVVGLISPWNLPLYLLSWKIAPAIACGNTCVCKPSELSPATAHLLGHLLNEAGVPRGVVNIVHGTGVSAGAALVNHPLVRAVSFTGGTATGASISRDAAPKFKKLSLELGGKNPTIVFDDADLERALPEVLRAAFTNQGQVCLCGSRIYVQRGIAKEFTRRFVSGADALRVGDPLEPGTEQGALISDGHRRKVLGAIERAIAEGGRVLTSRRADDAKGMGLPARCAGGFFVPPTVLEGLGPNCATQQQEIFGPVVTITEFESERDAIELANSTAYGLSASVWTREVARAHRAAREINAGTVWVNCWLLRDLRVPFGGVKDSGVGREGGEDALRFFTEPKNVCVRYE